MYHFRKTEIDGILMDLIKTEGSGESSDDMDVSTNYNVSGDHAEHFSRKADMIHNIIHIIR